VLPGFGDQRNLELLVEAGFSPIEAIHIASEAAQNGWAKKRTLEPLRQAKIQTW
jgi:hypothetical protein